MDRKIEKKSSQLKKWGWIGLTIIGLSTLYILAMSGSADTFRINAKKVTISTVTYVNFTSEIPLSGNIEPMHTYQIDATHGGIVDEIFVEEGTIVNQGDPIIRLNNSDMRLDYMNRETLIIEQINNLRSTRINLDQNKRQVEEQIVDVSYQCKEQERQFNIDSSLFSDQVISKTEYLESKASKEYLQKKLKLLSERKATDERYRQSQLESIDASIELMERNLRAIKKNLELLIIKAPITGQLNSFNHVIGQTKSQGQNLGRIDVLDSFIIRARVDQFYLNRLQNGQHATSSINGIDYNLEVIKIYPTISNNQFEIELAFAGNYPNLIRRGQSIQVKLAMAEQKKSLILPKGGFYQQSGGQYVYVLKDDGSAIKQVVELGSQNLKHIEVIKGLVEGDRVITSSYSQFNEAEKLIIEHYNND